MPQPSARGGSTPGPIRSLSRWSAWFLLGPMIALTMTGLRWEGRHWWCPVGDWTPIKFGIRSEHTSQHLLDPYSSTHVLHGVWLYAGLWLIMGRLRWTTRLLGAIALECGWELVENSASVIARYRAATVALGYAGDSIANSIGDIASCGIGFWLAGTLPIRWSIGLFLAVEVTLLIVYRDNLLLNVIMLIHSFDAVKAWQAAG